MYDGLRECSGEVAAWTANNLLSVVKVVVSCLVVAGGVVGSSASFSTLGIKRALTPTEDSALYCCSFMAGDRRVESAGSSTATSSEWCLGMLGRGSAVDGPPKIEVPADPNRALGRLLCLEGRGRSGRGCC